MVGFPTRLGAILLFSFAPALVAQQGLLASDPFTGNAGVLNGFADGSGWGAAWEVQNGSTAVPGYNIAAGAPLSALTGSYAIGGSAWQTAGRALDTTANGSFATYVANGLIGVPNSTLYVSVWMRMDVTTSDEISVTLHAGANPAWYVTAPSVSLGYFGAPSNSGSTRYWSCRVNGAVVRSASPIIVGQAAQLVLRIDFNTTSTVSLYVNPPASGLPTKPAASTTTTVFPAFRSVAYYGGSAANESSIDEIRIAASYSSLVNGATLPAPTGLTASAGTSQVALAWNPVAGASSYQVWRATSGAASQIATTASTTYLDMGLANGTQYTYFVIAAAPPALSPASLTASAIPQTAPHPSLGTNLAVVADYSRELPFVDAFKSARPWISQQQGQPWGQGPPLSLDSNGWILSLQPGQYAETILLDNALDDQAHYPTGNYTVLYDGEGTIAFDLQSASIASQTPGRMVVTVPAGGNGVYLMVTATNPKNPIRNIRFIMPGQESSYTTQPFNPDFLQAIQSYKCLRFMEWGLINGSNVQQWTDRALPADYTWMLRGVPLETQIQLANALNVAPWFNIPAKASDSYVKQFAALVKSQLKPGLSFYLEYSNETWNGSFSQSAYVQAQGLAMGFSSDPTVAAADYTAYRSTQIFSIVRSAIQPATRVIRVIGSQAANSWLSEQTVAFRSAYQQADALAIAPYFNCSDTASGGFGILGDPSTADQVAAMTVDGVIDIELQHITGCALQAMQSNSAIARKYGLKLVAYEGGQALVGYGGAENNATLTALFKAANRSTRMYDLYTRYLQNWVAAGGDLFVHFNDVTAFTKWGSWGALEYLNQDPAVAAKDLALSVFAAQYR